MKEHSIIEKIISDAEAKANLTIADAERAAADTLREADEKAEKTRKEQLELLVKRDEDYVEKKKINARLDCNKLILKTKIEILDDVFSRALGILKDLGEKEYVDFCGRMIEKYRDNKRLTKTFLVLSIIISLGLLDCLNMRDFFRIFSEKFLFFQLCLR